MTTVLQWSPTIQYTQCDTLVFVLTIHLSFSPLSVLNHFFRARVQYIVPEMIIFCRLLHAFFLPFSIVLQLQVRETFHHELFYTVGVQEGTPCFGKCQYKK